MTEVTRREFYEDCPYCVEKDAEIEKLREDLNFLQGKYDELEAEIEEPHRLGSQYQRLVSWGRAQFKGEDDG
jgi:hypothetical protein